MPAPAVREVVDSWCELSDRAFRSGRVQHVQVFENRGALMGASNAHPHGQIWTSAHVPSLPARTSGNLDAHWEQHGSDMLGDYLGEETARRERIVFEHGSWVALVPFWAVWPFEVMLIPKSPRSRLPELTGEERVELARALQILIDVYDSVFDCEFPYSMGWFQSPGDAVRARRLHAVFLPPLLRSATVRKFLVGYELTAEPQRDLTAEQAAEHLRRVLAQKR